MCEEELNKMLEGNISELGNTFFGRPNTHCYEPDAKYIHFFKNKKAIEFISHKYAKVREQNYYVCTFNIPLSTLLAYTGFGCYIKETDSRTIYKEHLEFAIPATEFKRKWIIHYSPAFEDNTPLYEK